ncbi:MAG: cupin domain-containing protein [Acidimicrobiia bacterium]|nr:cupin domain-containing protein [Acidimicrobiia bacterium]
MALQACNFDEPDETRTFEHGRADIVKPGSVVAGRSTLEPGWRWSTSVGPIARTESCQESHVGYVVTDRLHLRMDDGTDRELRPGDAVVIPPGHDAWVVGDEPCVVLDFAGAERYALPG